MRAMVSAMASKGSYRIVIETIRTDTLTINSIKNKPTNYSTIPQAT